MKTHKQRLMELCLSAMSVILAASALNVASAQNATTEATTGAASSGEQPETIVVVGIRQSLQKASDIKHDAVNTVESVLAEDIAKMPDLNLAESIQRMPGVAMTREGGEGRNITLRGFAPDFTATTLNGMEIPASTDGLDTGGFTLNAGRAFDFNVFAAELFNRIDIQKTQRASLEEGGIAGTVDLYTAKPFDFKGRTLVVSAQDGYSKLSKANDPRLTLLYSETFADDTVGVLLSAATSKRTVYQEGYSSVLWTSPYANSDSWDLSNPITVTGTPAASCPAANVLNCLWAPRLPRADFFGNNQKRTGLTGSLQFKPNDRLLLTFDALHSELVNDRYSYNSMEWLLTHGPASGFFGQTPLAFTVGPDGKQLIAASFNNVTSWYESRHQASTSKFDQFVLSGKYQIADHLSLDAMAGSAKDNADRSELRFYFRSKPHFYSYDYSANPYVPIVSFGGYNPSDPNNYLDSVIGADRLDNILKQNATSKANLTYDGGTFSIKAGLAYNDRKVQYSDATGSTQPVNPTQYAEPFPYSNFGSGLGYPGLTPFAVANFSAIAAAGLVDPAGYAANVGADWTVEESTLGGYLEFNSEFQLGTMRLRTNYGIRYVSTAVTSKAVLSGTPIEVKKHYDNYLPSMNFALDITKQLTARLAFGRSMSRPGLDSLNIAGPVFGYTTRTVGNLGDPGLKPYQSNDTDLSLEWYFPKGGLVSLGLFNKDIVSSLTTQTVTKFVDPVYLPAIYADPQYIAVANPTLDPALVPYTFTSVVNTDNGNSVKGVEFTYNQPFTFLRGWLANFGVASNVTHVEARDSTGLSPNSYNFTFYYDSAIFGARVAVNKRDDYLVQVNPGNGNATERKVGPTQVDMEAFYNLNDHLSFSLEGINITDESERIYDTGLGTQDLTRQYTHTGAEWFVGARYKL
jgi:iron complex outermembrane receptor protein